MKKLMPLAGCLALVISCTSSAPPPATETLASVPDSEIGLAPGTAFEQPAQAPIAFNTADPGESELREPPNPDFPPVIPHTVADLEVITMDENPCLECHDPVVAPEVGAVAVPSSHFVDLRRSPSARGHEVVGSRWVCTSCHVAQTDAAELVANSSSG